MSTETKLPGKLMLAGETYSLPCVYARQEPNPFDKTKTMTVVLAADRELGPEARTDERALRELTWSGKLNGVEIEMTGAGINWQIRSAGPMGGLSGSQSPDPYELQVEGGRVTGTVRMREPARLFGSEYFFEFDVDAAIEVKPETPAPTPADREAARESAAAKAYLAYQEALRAGDREALRRAVHPDRAAEMDGPEFDEVLGFLQEMQPRSVEVLRAAETGETAVLTVSGEGTAHGEVRMQRIGGAWLVGKESWGE
jgi:hypothetical protein